MSGVHMLPMVFGLLLSSTVSGQIVSRTGRWKVFPVAGTAVTTLGLLLLHQLNDQHSTTAEMKAYFFVFGLGLGLVMQVLVLIVQNAVAYEDLGVATSGATFFRSIGRVVRRGHLRHDLREPPRRPAHGRLPGHRPAARRLRGHPQGRPARHRRPAARAAPRGHPRLRLLHHRRLPVRRPHRPVAFLLAWFLKEDRLRGSVTAPDAAQTLASNPVERSSHDEVCRALSVLGTREGRREIYRRITARAGYDLLPASSWMLLRVRKYGRVEPAQLAERSPVPLATVMAAARQVEERHLAVREGPDLVLTGRGREVAERLALAREDSLAELLGDWWGPGPPDRPGSAGA
ncbi:MFS transporter OS=Streptomyces tendae OX=1932 GN=GUR47_10745 PE=4 SV=1 [Streptomyces tendae]